MMDKLSISQKIKIYSLQLGFDACGFCKAEYIGDEQANRVREWLDKSYHANMDYMAKHWEKRCDPRLLVDGVRSIISLAVNYYPNTKQLSDAPQFAYYAYGKDYHDVMRGKLQMLFDYIKTLIPSVNGRIFCDTAPILERYWAAKGGIGFIGKNSLLIIPRKGSFYFLGELLVDIDLEYDRPLALSCGSCSRCVDACPGKAITDKMVDCNKCISYQTIENRGEIDAAIKPVLNNYVYGCDICQQVCPWNRYARPHNVAEFEPSQAFLDLDFDNLSNLSVEQYKAVFNNSAVKRAKYEGLKRNIEVLKQII